MIFTIYGIPKRLWRASSASTQFLRSHSSIQPGDWFTEAGWNRKPDFWRLTPPCPTTWRRVRTGAAIKPTPIARPGEKREEVDLYGSLSFSSELVFERIPDAVVYHCSTLAEAANGDLLCLWYGGSYESADDQTLFLAREAPANATGSCRRRSSGGPEPLPGNGVIFVDGHERVWIVWCRMEGPRPIGRGQRLGQLPADGPHSTDHGLTWSEDTEFLKDKLRARAAESARASRQRRSGAAFGSHRRRGGGLGVSDWLRKAENAGVREASPPEEVNRRSSSETTARCWP